MADDDTVITIEPDALPSLTQASAAVKANGADTAKAGAEHARKDDALADLKAQYEDLQKGKQAADEQAGRDRAARLQAEADAQRARTDASTARSEAVDTELSAIDQGIQAATTQRTSARTAYKTAAESGDWDAAAHAQEDIATAAARLERLTDAKAAAEVRKTQAASRAETDTTRTVPADPVEAFIATRSAPTQTWLRAHKDWLADQKKADKLTAGHHDALAEGIAVDTPEYFAHIEKHIGLTKAAPAPDNQPQANQQQRRRSSVPAAPVNGGGGSVAGSGGPVEVRLSRGQAEAATDGSLTWNAGDVAAKRCAADMLGKPIGVNEMARRIYLMEQERPGLFQNGNIEG